MATHLQTVFATLHYVSEPTTILDLWKNRPTVPPERLSDHIPHSAIATIPIPVFVFVEFCVVLGAFETLAAVRAFYGVFHGERGTGRRTARGEGCYSRA